MAAFATPSTNIVTGVCEDRHGVRVASSRKRTVLEYEMFVCGQKLIGQV